MSIKEKAEKFFNKFSEIIPAIEMLPKNDKRVLFNVIDNLSFIVTFNKRGIFIKHLKKLQNTKKKSFDLVVEADKDTYLKIFNNDITPAEAYQCRKLFFGGIPYKEYPWLTRFIRIIQTKRYKG